MGFYHKQNCPICQATIETDRVIDYCPACKEYIRDKLESSGNGTGINTARTSGPNFRPLGGTIQDVY